VRAFDDDGNDDAACAMFAALLASSAAMALRTVDDDRSVEGARAALLLRSCDPLTLASPTPLRCCCCRCSCSRSALGDRSERRCCCADKPIADAPPKNGRDAELERDPEGLAGGTSDARFPELADRGDDVSRRSRARAAAPAA